MATLPVLYSYFRSSSSFRVRIALNLLRIPHKIVPVNLLKSEQISSGHLSLNPEGKVPMLVTGDVVMTQSIAIIDYIDRFEHLLIPVEEISRSRVLAAAMICTADIQPLHNVGVLRSLQVDDRGPWSLWATRKGLASFSAHSEKYGDGRFCIGDKISLADVCLAPQIYSAERFGIDVVKEFPLLARINANLMEMEEFRAAHPHAQDDCPQEFI